MKHTAAVIKLCSILIICCLGSMAYSNSFLCSFHLDDTSCIADNHAIRNIFDLRDIWNFWPCRFLTSLSFALNYHFNGLNVWGYHLFNLVVHLVSAILVWWLTLLTLSTPALKAEKISGHAGIIALFAGLIFAVHPLQTQAVTYIVQRAASMAALFYVASLCFYIKSRLLQGGISRFYYIGAMLCAILAMFTKEMTITLPVMILFYEAVFFKTKKDIAWSSCRTLAVNRKYLFPFICTLLIIPLTMLFTKSVNFQEMHRVTEGAPHVTPMHYLLTQIRVMATYIRLVFLPFGQNLDYDYPVSTSIFEFPVLISLLFLISILYCAKRLFLKYRLVSFSILWFFLTLLPESSILPINDVIFEHRLYLPMVGVSIFFVSSVYYLWGKHGIKVTGMILTMIVACFLVLTYSRNNIWKDEFTLWNDVIAKSPQKARGYNSRGYFYFQQKNAVAAIADFNKAIELDPDYANAYCNRGRYYFQQKNIMAAIVEYSEAIELDPDYADAYFNRGLAYFDQGDFTRAGIDFNRAIELKPDSNPEAYNNRGLIYASKRDFSRALADFVQAIKIDPDYAKAYCNLGNIHFQEGDYDQAAVDYNKAIEIDPADKDAYRNRGLVFEQLRKNSGP